MGLSAPKSSVAVGAGPVGLGDRGSEDREDASAPEEEHVSAPEDEDGETGGDPESNGDPDCVSDFVHCSVDGVERVAFVVV